MPPDETEAPTFTAAQLKRKLTGADVAPLIAAIAPVVKQHVADAVAPLAARITALEQRRAMSYRGLFDDAAVYEHGDTVTLQGAAWVAQRDSKGETPGKSNAWKLAIKSVRQR